MRAARLTTLATLALAAAFAAGCSDDNDNANVIGSTQGWLNGQTVTFDYTQQFSCTTPPASQATSGCEVGAAAQTFPAGASASSDTLWVLVPLFTPAPASATLQCPTAGACVAHPATIDVSAALGPTVANVPTPPHSHIIDQSSGDSQPWQIVVVAIDDAAVWDAIVQGKSLAALRAQQAANPANGKISADLPTNLFLFFATRS